MASSNGRFGPDEDGGEGGTNRDEREGKPGAELREEHHRACEKQQDRHDAEE